MVANMRADGGEHMRVCSLSINKKPSLSHLDAKREEPYELLKFSRRLTFLSLKVVQFD